MANILVYENSSGFASYSYKLCNALVEIDKDNKYFYLTDSANIYLNEIDERVTVKADLLVPSNIKSKGLLWMINRLYVGISNILKRNNYIRKMEIEYLNIQSTLSVLDQFFLIFIPKRVKIITTAHDVIPPVKSFYWTRRSLKKLYFSSDLVIVHSLSNKKQLMEQFNYDEKKIVVIHHGVDTKYKKFSRDVCCSELNIPNDNIPFLLFFGMIREQKGLDILIKAINKVNSPCKLIIAGAMPHGESFQKYKTLMEDERKFICQIGFIEENKLDYLFQMANVVVFPYKYFLSQSGVFMECLKYGKPVIATDVSSFRQYIEEYKMGLVAIPNDVDDLASKIENYLSLSDEEKKLFRNNLEKAAMDNSWEKAAELYLKVFNNWTYEK